MHNFIETIGLIAGFCTTVAFLPQIIKVWCSRSTKDISIFMYLIFCTGLFLWIIYGLFVRSFPIVIANVVTLFLAASIVVMKIKWSNDK